MEQSKLANILGIMIVGFALAGVYQLGAVSELQGAGLQLRQSVLGPFKEILSGVNDSANLLSRLQSTQIENLSLRQEVLDLTAQLGNELEIQQENEFLRSQLRLEVPVSQNFQVGEVLEYQHSPTPGKIFLAIDNPSLVTVGDWLVESGFLAGRITEVGKSYAVANVLYSPNFLEQVKVGETFAEVYGNGANQVLTEIANEDELTEKLSVKLLNPQNPILNKYVLGFTQLEESGWAVSSPLLLDQLDYVFIVPSL